jgi:two-component sensor histidine kinase
MMTESSSHGGEAERIARLEAELAEARERLREFDHRIKNDLQLIASIFMLQLRKAPPGRERDVVRGALERVNCVLAVHRRLSPAQDLARLEVAPLIREVVDEAVGAARREDIRVDYDLAPLAVPSRQAAPLALIVGELVRNALRYAYPSSGGRIAVRLARKEGGVELMVADEGVGRAHGAHGFGATLVGLLAQQLRGEFEWSDARPGVRAVVRFPEAT